MTCVIETKDGKNNEEYQKKLEQRENCFNRTSKYFESSQCFNENDFLFPGFASDTLPSTLPARLPIVTKLHLGCSMTTFWFQKLPRVHQSSKFPHPFNTKLLSTHKLDRVESKLFGSFQHDQRRQLKSKRFSDSQKINTSASSRGSASETRRNSLTPSALCEIT